MSYLALLSADVLDELWKFTFHLETDTPLLHSVPDSNYLITDDAKVPCERPSTNVECITCYGTTPYHTRLEITRMMYTTPARMWVVIEEFRDNIGGFSEYALVTTYRSKSRRSLLKYFNQEYLF